MAPINTARGYFNKGVAAKIKTKLEVVTSVGVFNRDTLRDSLFTTDTIELVWADTVRRINIHTTNVQNPLE